MGEFVGIPSWRLSSSPSYPAPIPREDGALSALSGTSADDGEEDSCQKAPSSRLSSSPSYLGHEKENEVSLSLSLSHVLDATNVNGTCDHVNVTSENTDQNACHVVGGLRQQAFVCVCVCVCVY